MWPGPMYQQAQMAKITNTEHDSIFTIDTHVGEGAEDGAGAAMATGKHKEYVKKTAKRNQ